MIKLNHPQKIIVGLAWLLWLTYIGVTVLRAPGQCRGGDCMIAIAGFTDPRFVYLWVAGFLAGPPLVVTAVVYLAALLSRRQTV